MAITLIRQLRQHVSSFRHHSTTAHESITSSLRALLRSTAQPVAVVTSFMPANQNQSSSSGALYHGATLSSLTSISMDPYPLVAFALRIPSRMATSLKYSSQPSHMVINLLSAEQSSVAEVFSRPDLHTHPFTTVPFTLNGDGLPVIKGSLGAMSCKLAATVPLYDLEYLEQTSSGGDIPERVQVREGVASELFIARVTRVEGVDVEDTQIPKQPLLYYRRHYTTVSPIPQRTSS
ncbi:hypothetical protein AX15_007427 [Amanita polypyramis BW_CC]|nr:hypothetical protein AX15_007427 [Amanita polypyramis BW_CC]